MRIEIIYKYFSLGILFAKGNRWRDQRRFVLFHIKNLGYAKTPHEHFILEEIEDLVKNLIEMGPIITKIQVVQVIPFIRRVLLEISFLRLNLECHLRISFGA